MSEYIHKSHNVKVLLRHMVVPAKYRRAVSDDQVDEVLKELCLEIGPRYQMKFPETGTDKDHVHFLVQVGANLQGDEDRDGSRSITAREIFRRCPYVKKTLSGGEFWTDGYFMSMVGKHCNEEVIGRYVKNQGKEYNKLHADHQITLF